jgi:hypothetical protein
VKSYRSTVEFALFENKLSFFEGLRNLISVERVLGFKCL